MWQYLLFDLDGTLTDPKVGITKSVQYALRHHGIDVENPDELCPFIGPPLRDSFRKYYGFDEREAEDAVAKYREYFAVTGIYENTMYEGVPDMLEALKSQGRRLVLATSKPTVFADIVLLHFDLAKYFDFVSGSELDGARSEKIEVIRYALAHCPADDLKDAVMVGDREYDILGAKAVGVSSVGVLYGYGDYDELRLAGAGRIVRSVSELTEALL